jgi:hypothetical protein
MSNKKSSACSQQGDQIGRFFAYLPVVYFEQLFENYTSRQIFGQLFSEAQVVY